VTYGSKRLADLTTEKVEVQCECGLTRRYDRRALIDRVGNADCPSLLRRLADAEGCKRANTVSLYEICQLGYREGTFS